MKTGEKIALRLAFGAIAGLIGLAVILEMRVQNKTATDKLAGLAENQASLDRANSYIPKGINPEALPEPHSRGSKALTLYCVQCHELPVPAMHSPEEWNAVLTRMQEYMQDRRGGMLSRLVMPSDQDWAVLNEYLEKHAQIPMDATQLSDLDTPAGRSFLMACSQCHAAPDPRQHTVREWPRIVLRMKANMKSAGIDVPDDETTELIVGFLNKHGESNDNNRPGTSD